uniref:NADH dehydrogenase subunit 6 n=1 Tax=Abia mengmeng TaxID=2798524 RepID=UPI002237963E|nr:NADH dehydrogenase subunit 6 [Abia mengmeng]UYK52128.1 NADH dehydrogenase subunit 6 [Abia mengmeng]
MMKNILILIVMNSLMLLFCKTPLHMGLILLLQTTLISLSSELSTFNFFYLYILFMILIGSMMVLFIYISSLTPNMKFKINKMMLMTMLMLMIVTMIMLLYFNFKPNFDSLNYDNFMIMNKNFTLKLSLKKMFDYPSNLMLLMLINFLLITLFISVKIINIKNGPLRKIN